MKIDDFGSKSGNKVFTAGTVFGCKILPKIKFIVSNNCGKCNVNLATNNFGEKAD